MTGSQNCAWLGLAADDLAVHGSMARAYVPPISPALKQTKGPIFFTLIHGGMLRWECASFRLIVLFVSSAVVPPA